MSSFVLVLASSLAAALATGAGALPILFRKSYSQTSLNFGMGFSAGIMLVASFVSLLLPGFEHAKLSYEGNWGSSVVLAGLFMGYFAIIGFHEILPHEHFFKQTDMFHRKQLSRVTLIIMAIALHNIPEGLSVGVGFGGGDHGAAFSLTAAIAIQNFPEGLVVALGMMQEGASRSRAFWLALLTGLVEPVAAVIGFFLTQVSSYALPPSLGFAAGAMLFVICQEIFPELFKEGSEKIASLGLVSGMALMLMIDFWWP